MSHPLQHRGKYIVLTMNDGQLRYHIGSPFSTGYESLTAARLAIDAAIDAVAASRLDARGAYYLVHVTAAAHLAEIARLRLSECL